MIAPVSGKRIKDIVGQKGKYPVRVDKHDPEASRDKAAKGLQQSDIEDVSNAVPKFAALTNLEQVKELKQESGEPLSKADQKRILKVLKGIGFGQAMDREKGEFLSVHIAISHKPTDKDPKNQEIKITADFGTNFARTLDKHGFFNAVFGWIPNMFRTVDAKTMSKFVKSGFNPGDPDNTAAELHPGLKRLREGIEAGRYTTSVMFDVSSDSPSKKPIALQVYDNMKSQLEHMQKLVESLGEDNPMAKQIQTQLAEADAEGLDKVCIAGTTFVNPELVKDFIGKGNNQMARRESLQAMFAETMNPGTVLISPLHVFAADDAATRGHVSESVDLTSVEIVDGKLVEHKGAASIIRDKASAFESIPAAHLAQFFAAHTLYDIAERPDELTKEMQATLMDIVKKNTVALEAFNERIAPAEKVQEETNADTSLAQDPVKPSRAEAQSSKALST
ncbi:MAG: hypothetical protein O3C63_03155 [Cyanobacteria bacterium]|nr:hypothetical protein [Cyanobacteriota bacterium]